VQYIGFVAYKKKSIVTGILIGYSAVTWCVLLYDTTIHQVVKRNLGRHPPCSQITFYRSVNPANRKAKIIAMSKCQPIS
jgi:hypothetical protein